MRVPCARCSLGAGLVAIVAAAAQLRAAPQPGDPQTLRFGNHEIDWRGAERIRATGGEVSLILRTNRGQIAAQYHPVAGDAPRDTAGVIWLSGAGGGVDGPARRLYPEASRRLQQQGIASLRLDYRRPEDLPACVLDALCGVAFFAGEGIHRVALVGHSFGGAVAISAGVSSPRVRAVAALASQTAGSVQMAPHLAPRSLLVVHGTRDKILPVFNARKIYEVAGEPKQLRLLNDVGHGLSAARDEILDLLTRWIPEQLRARAP